jgi:DNA-binding CsgD family transcriptional regulator
VGKGQTEKLGAASAGDGDGDGDGERNDPGNGLFERETELAALSAALAAARAGTGGLVVLEGPAGIGKSRLLAEARAMADALGMTVLTARGIDLERDAPFGIAADLFAATLAKADETGPHSERARLLSGQAVLAAALFDPALFDAALFDPGAPPAADSSALVRGLYWLTVNAAANVPGEERPGGLLIQVDDAQWADRPSMSYLAYLAARIDELPAVLMIAVRSGEAAVDQQALDWLRDRPGRALVRPRALSPEAIGLMAAAELAAAELAPAEMAAAGPAAGLPAADPAFTRACAEVTGGNPFLAAELLRALRADGIAPTASSVARVRSLVPDSVLRAVLVRLARLGEPAEQLAKAVAVLGNRAPMRQARLLAGLDATPAEQAADALAGAHIMTPGEPLRFAHPLIATSVYTDIPAFARARAHRRAAEVLAADGAAQDVVVAQLLLTRPDGDQRTVATLREAAARALTRGDPGAAVHLLQRAVTEPPGPAERGEVLLELANAEIERGDAGAADHINEAIPLLEAPAVRVRALAALGRLRFNQGAHEAAARVMEEALELLPPEDPALPPLLVGYLTATMFRAGLNPLATARLRPMIEAARAGQPPPDPGLLAHLAVRFTFAAEPVARIRELAERATAADPLVDPASLGILNGLVVQALCAVDELAAAERISDAALASARRRGSLLSFTMASYHRAIGRYHRGELTSALADLDQARVATREGWTAGDSWSGGLRVHIHLERGDLAAARDALEQIDDPPPGSMDFPIGLFARASLALAAGEPAQALRDAETAGQLLRDGFGIDHPGFVPWQRTAVMAALALAEHDRARQRADELLERARWSGVARAIGLALRTQAALADGEERRRLLEEAANVLAGSPSTLERAHALVELGTACRRTGLRPAAERRLREGMQLADAMGAAPLVEAARHELRALGLRPRRSAVTGPDSLTPTERRVAELAASGLTNRQTAEALFVTVKTVETHLARIYQKLGIGTRTELQRAIGS